MKRLWGWWHRAGTCTPRAPEHSTAPYPDEEMLRTFAHDLRSPQASILALLDLRKAQPDLIPEADTCEQIRKHADKTLALAENFVRLVRAKNQPLKLDEVNPGQLLHDAADATWSQANARDIDLVREIPEEEGFVLADRTALTHVFTNLLSNAVTYSPSGTTVTLALTIGHNEWQIRIADQGYGIAEADLPKLFQPFCKIGAGQAQNHPGSGLGLAFAKIIAEKHGGRIEIISQPEQGTVFTVILPLNLR